ncbi:MAG: substrate-binding domain-containing protein, partial [Bradyrhizobium sp.]
MYRIAGVFAALAVLCGLLLSPVVAKDQRLTVFAAASMKNALDDLNTAYAANTGVRIVASYAASSTLAK